MPRYLSDRQIEAAAARLLNRYQTLADPIATPPVPIERLVEDLLGLGILWDPIQEPPGETILAALAPRDRLIVFNETRRSLIEDTQGLYSTILAHEAGHWELHVDRALLDQPPLPGMDPPAACLFRRDQALGDPIEVQAHRFMGCLLLPPELLIPAVRETPAGTWPALYHLRARFDVTITALTIRLQHMGLSYVGPDGNVHPSRQEYQGQRRL